MTWLTTKHPSVYVRHRQGAKACPANDGQRCRCEPSYRVRYTDAAGAKKWSRAYKNLDEARSFQVDARKVTPDVIAQRSVGTLNQLFTRFMGEVRSGRVTAKAGRPYAPATVKRYEFNYDLHINPAYGDRDAASLSVIDWQLFVDEMSRAGLKRNTVQLIMAGVRAMYRWACAPTRRLLPVNETRGLEFAAKDETPRDRIATPDEARRLISALRGPDVADFALALYAGMRNKERMGLDWADVIDLRTIRVRREITKSDAGVRTLPVIARLRPILTREWMAQGQPTTGAVIPPCHETSRTRRADKAWSAADLDRITPHECRHTFASYNDRVRAERQGGYGAHGPFVRADHL